MTPRNKGNIPPKSHRVWIGTNLDAINEDTTVTTHQGPKSPLYDPYTPLQPPSQVSPTALSSPSTSMQNNNNNRNSPLTTPVAAKRKTRRKTRRGGYKPPRIAPQPTHKPPRHRKYRKIVQIPQQLQPATHAQLPNATPTNDTLPDKSQIDSDLLD